MDTELAGTSHQSAATGAVVNNLLMRVLPRSFVGSRFVCQAQGSPMIEPVSKEVTIQMHCKWPFIILFFITAPPMRGWRASSTLFPSRKIPVSRRWWIPTAGLDKIVHANSLKPSLNAHNFLFLTFLSIVSFLSAAAAAVKPTKVKIVSANNLLVAGKKTPLRCEAWGSAPPGLYYNIYIYMHYI